MNDNRIQELISRYNAQLVNEAELKEIEQLIAAGLVSMDDLQELKMLDDQILRLDDPSPSSRLNDNFYQLLSHEIKKERPSAAWTNIFSWPDLWVKVAIASVTLIIGFLGGRMIQSPAQKTEISTLSKEVSDLKEMMMLSLLEKESASDRLKAVSLTEEMPDASNKVTHALLQTLNNDANINVRLAALEALIPYSKDEHIREELIRSIAKQESPLVQVALAELMVTLQEKSSVKELEKILHNEHTPKDVRKKIKQSITVLT